MNNTYTDITIYLIYESRDDWIVRHEILNNNKFYSRFLASEKEIKIIQNILEDSYFKVEVLMYPHYSMKQINNIISQDNKIIVWNLTDGYELFIGAHIPSFVHFFNKPYIGSSSFVQILCQNKHMTKSILNDMGITTPKWISIDINDDINTLKFDTLDYPFFIKPSKFDNSIGTEFIEPIAKNHNDAINKIKDLKENGIDDILIEEYIEGEEITIAAINTDKWYILPIIRHYDGDYISSYSKDNEKGFLKNQTICNDINLVELGQKIINILDIKDYCRIDLKVKNNKFYILEVNSATFLTTVSFEILAKEFFTDTKNMFKNLILNSYTRQQEL